MKPYSPRASSRPWIVAGFLSIVLFALSLTVGASLGGQDAATPERAVPLRPVDVVPGQYIVVFHGDLIDPSGLANALGRRHGFALRHSYAFALKGFAARMPAAVVESLAEDPEAFNSRLVPFLAAASAARGG